MNGRLWTMDDLDAIAALERDCFSDPWSRRMLVESFLSERFFGVVLEEGGAVVGYGGLSVAADEGEIELVAVNEMYRRCGRGKLIMDDLISLARERGVKRLYLEVRVSNAPAQMLYLRCGFRGLYARSRYYPDGEDALVMVREFD